MSEPARLLVVCTGNVCRSPYLERLLQAALDRSWGAGAVEVRSAGTGALVGHPMDPAVLDRLRSAGGEGDDFRARALTVDLVAPAQLVLTATRDHRAAVVRLAPRALARTFTLLDLADLARDLPDEALPAVGAARDRLAAVVPLVAARRGRRPPLPPQEADLVDPFRRDAAVLDRMTGQVAGALPQVLRVLGDGGR
ncbi:low molecular weight phosphatase family protein [Arsenicicoccus dermatophilus]|uniref:arsenate reductase/protein-tyrosine-phosphatase family protein n=1 Tax=Arsenicicoccus dermatophilus TaxID=1076331 RepID=UPI00391758F4